MLRAAIAESLQQNASAESSAPVAPSSDSAAAAPAPAAAPTPTSAEPAAPAASEEAAAAEPAAAFEVAAAPPRQVVAQDAAGELPAGISDAEAAADHADGDGGDGTRPGVMADADEELDEELQQASQQRCSHAEIYRSPRHCQGCTVAPAGDQAELGNRMTTHSSMRLRYTVACMRRYHATIPTETRT